MYELGFPLVFCLIIILVINFRMTAFLFLKLNIWFLPGLKSTLTRSFFYCFFFQFNLSCESFIQQLIVLSFLWLVIEPVVSIRLILMV